MEKIFERKGSKAIATQVNQWGVTNENGKLSDVVMRSVAVIGKYALKKSRQNILFADDSERFYIIKIQKQKT